MKKIYIDKHDNISLVIERILNITDREIIVYIPRFTESLSSINNLKLLKKEVEAAGKKVVVESVDEKILKIALSLGMKASNPFFQKRSKPVSDILSPNDPAVFDDVDTEDLQDEVPKRRIKHERKRGSGIKFDFSVHRLSFRKPITFVSVVVIVLGLVGIIIFILPRADIKLTFDKLSWDFDGSLLVASNIKESGFVGDQIRVRGAVFEKQETLSSIYPATGTETVERRAEGKINIFNAYSSDPQPLVKETRFVTPDGKIFRIYKDVVVPGAKIVDNKIVASSIEVPVRADKPGVEYNIAKSKFRVPGFQGSPKYEGFYAESSESMTGGFIGEIKIPTDSDKKKARDGIKATLENNLKSSILLGTPEDIKILDKAFQFAIIKEESEDKTDDTGNFKITSTGSIKLIGMKEDDLMSVLRSRLLSEAKTNNSLKDSMVLSGEIEESNIELRERSLEYGEPRIDFTKGEMSLSIHFKSVWTRALDVDEFREDISGESRKGVEAIISGIPGVEAEVRLWPIWVRAIPEKASKINIDVE